MSSDRALMRTNRRIVRAVSGRSGAIRYASRRGLPRLERARFLFHAAQPFACYKAPSASRLSLEQEIIETKVEASRAQMRNDRAHRGARAAKRTSVCEGTICHTGPGNNLGAAGNDYDLRG